MNPEQYFRLGVPHLTYILDMNKRPSDTNVGLVCVPGLPEDVFPRVTGSWQLHAFAVKAFAEPTDYMVALRQMGFEPATFAELKMACMRYSPFPERGMPVVSLLDAVDGPHDSVFYPGLSLFNKTLMADMAEATPGRVPFFLVGAIRPEDD